MTAVLFPPATVALLTALNSADLPHAAQVYGLVRTPAPGGESTVARTLLRTLPCRLSAIGSLPQERLTADQLQAVDQYRVVFAAGATVLPAHELVVTGTDVAGVAWTLPLAVVSIAAFETAETQRTALCTVVRA